MLSARCLLAFAESGFCLFAIIKSKRTGYWGIVQLLSVVRGKMITNLVVSMTRPAKFTTLSEVSISFQKKIKWITSMMHCDSSF